MNCRVCGGLMEERITDLPFKVSDTSIVIVKGLPASQCRQCHDVELDHPVMTTVERMLDAVDRGAELEVIRYAA